MFLGVSTPFHIQKQWMDSSDPKFFGTSYIHPYSMSNSDQTLHVIELHKRKVIFVTKMLMCNLFAVANLCFCLLIVLLMLAALTHYG